MTKAAERSPTKTERRQTKPGDLSLALRDRESLSVREFAALHGLSVATIYRRAKEGGIRLSHFGGRTLITRQAADAWQARMAASDTQAVP